MVFIVLWDKKIFIFLFKLVVEPFIRAFFG
jgi:hypothetical protein